MTQLLALELAAKSALAAGVTLLLLRLLAQRSAAERSWLAHVGLLVTLLVPFAGEALPRWHLAAAPQTVVTEMAAPVVSTVHIDGSSPPAVETSAPSVGGGTLLLLAWLLPAGLLLGVTGVAIVRLFALRRRASVLTDAPWLSALAHAQRRMGFKNGAALLSSPDFASPVSWGIVRPTIVVSERMLDATADAEAIIAHELAHVARLDWLKLLLARVATALFWFNPLVWTLAKACHQLREEAADDAVLLSDVRNVDYAQLLVGAARHDRSGLLLAANGVAPGRTSLGRRVTRVLDGTAGRSPATAGWSLACIGTGVLLGAPLGMMTATPAHLSSPVQVPSEASASARAAQLAAVPFAVPAAAPVTVAAPVAAMAAPLTRAAPAVAAPMPPAPSAAPVPPHAADGDRDWAALAANGIGPADIAAWAAVSPSYGRFDTNAIVALQANGVTAGWLRDMAALGYHDLPFRTILAMTVQGVSPAFVREMRSAGYADLTCDQLVRMRIHGVSAALVQRLARQGTTGLSADQLIRAAIVGFDPRRPPGPDDGFPFDRD